MKDLGITVNDCLCFDSHIDTVVAKTYRIFYGILKSFYTCSPKFLMAMFKIYVRPLLENNAIIWFPTSLKYIDKCERIQRYLKKKLRYFWHVPYLSRLEQLNVELLEERRLNIDMICIKFSTGFVI